jgi:hypothetical protein
MVKKSLFIFLFVLFLTGFVLAENESINNAGNQTGNFSGNETTIDLTNVSNATIEIRNFFPTSISIGDIQLNINVKNIGSSELTNLGAFISGDGFSSYDVVMVDSLLPGEKSYIIVNGNFKKSGNINLTIKINQEIFYKTVSVLDSSINISLKNKEFGENISNEFGVLKNNYAILESAVSTKKIEGYDVSGISLVDLKGLIRDAQAFILEENFIKAQVKINLAIDEHDSLKLKLENVKKISLSAKLKDNSVLFSTIAGAIITFFTLYELLKKKKENLKETIVSMKKKEVKENK